MILSELEEKGYVTVRYLTGLLGVSTATVNRDLNELQGRQLVTRGRGGAELNRSGYVPVFFRAHRMQLEKREISRAAAACVRDGETIFVDASTTAQCMGGYLARRRNLTVLTNNMLLAAELGGSEVGVICLGGRVAEAPCMLCSSETVENAARYRVDKMFFSTEAATSDGRIASGLVYDLLFRTIARNAGEIFYLVDHNKIDLPFHAMYGDFGAVDCVVSDYDFPEATRARYPRTRFLHAGREEENPEGGAPAP